MRTLIVHNEKAGFGSDGVFEFERALVRSGDECVLRSISPELTSTQALSDAEDFDVVVLSGGDGTVTSMLYELRGRDVTSCVYPSGTANLLFASLGLALEPAAIARACRVGATAPIDLGEISWEGPDGSTHTRGFGIMSGTGFDARLMKAAVPNKQSMGEMSYYAAALEDPHPATEHFVVTVDGEAHEREAVSCIVANTAKIQGDIEVVPDCRMDDGKTDVILLELSDVTQLLEPLFAGLLDPSGHRRSRPHVESFRGHDIDVVSDRPLPIEVDGEPVDEEAAGYHVRTLSGAVRVVVDPMSPYYHGDGGGPRFSGAQQLAYPDATPAPDAS